MTTSDRLRTWTRRGLDVTLVLLVVTCLLTIAIARLVPMTGRSTFVVAGGSMVPALSVGSAVVLEPVDPRSLAVGDVVSLRSGPQRAIFTHRIVRLVDRGGTVWIETKGDANATADTSLTAASDVIGRVSASAPVVGYLIALLSAPVGITFVISLGVLLLFAGWMLESPGMGRRRVAADDTDEQVAEPAVRAPDVDQARHRRLARRPTKRRPRGGTGLTRSGSPTSRGPRPV